MAKGTTHIAVWEGQTFTRTSKSHTYSHMVAMKEVRSDARAYSEKTARSSWKMNLSYLTQTAEGTAPSYAYMTRYNATPEEFAFAKAERMEEAKATLAYGEEGAVARELAMFDERWPESEAYRYGSLGWASRRDLAEKNLAGIRTRYAHFAPNAEYAILPTIIGA